MDCHRIIETTDVAMTSLELKRLVRIIDGVLIHLCSVQVSYTDSLDTLLARVMIRNSTQSPLVQTNFSYKSHVIYSLGFPQITAAIFLATTVFA